ncbi:MAG: hypothetical protein Kow00124_03330 [Anaerolineae bacterium]
MEFREQLQPVLETLASQYAKNKLLLIHPGSRYRTLLIAALLADPPCDLFYYSLGLEDVGLDQFLTGLAQGLAAQNPIFGRYLERLRHTAPGDITRLAAALAEDLHDLDNRDYLLILDEYDRADAIPEIHTFVETLLDYMPAQCHLLINSRTLPRLPWVSLIARGQAVVLRDAHVLNSGFYPEHSAENPTVEVYALGPGHVLVNGERITDWAGHLPRLILFFVLDRPLATRAEICQAFWPELPIDQAVNVFHVTKRRLHKTLGFDALVHEDGHYRLNPAANLRYDVLEFVSNLVEARNAVGAQAAAFWQEAVNLYRGSFLQGYDEPWILQRRADFRQGYLEALTGLAHFREHEGQIEVALGHYLRAVAEAPDREDLHREVIRLYGRLGRRDDAVEHYQQLEADLKERYGDTPSAETRRVFKEATGS